MGITSAAEAKLDARIRPDISVLRSRTPYPRRHRPALAALPGGAQAGPAADDGGGPTQGGEGSARTTETISRTVSTERTNCPNDKT